MIDNQKIRICFISTYVYPLFNSKSISIHGGSELQLYLLSNEISKKNNFEISFITGDFGQDNIEYFKRIKLYKSFNPKSDDSILKKLIQAITYYKLCNKINADIYFTSAANSTVGLISLYCKLNNKKHIHRTAHENEVNLEYNNKGILGKLYIKGLKNSDLVITQNETHKKLLKKCHNISAIVFKNSFPIELNNISEKNSIIWVARCEHWKRPELFIKLAQCFQNEKFIMIAPPANGKIDYQEEIKAKAKAVLNLTFIDRVPFNMIQKYFNSAMLFVNTSESEGFPNTFLQAGIGKTPILSLNVNPDNFIDEYNCGFFCGDSFDKLITFTNIMINDNEMWNIKSKNIFEYTKNHHNIYKNAGELAKIIDELLEK